MLDVIPWSWCLSLQKEGTSQKTLKGSPKESSDLSEGSQGEGSQGEGSIHPRTLKNPWRMRDFGPDWGSLKRWGWFTQLPKAFKNPNWKSSKESQIRSRSDPHVLQPKQSGRPKIPKNPPFRSKFWNLPSPRATAKNCETKSVWMIHCVTSRNLQLHGQTSKDTNRHVKIIFFFLKSLLS